MKFMFWGAESFNQPLNNWNVSNVEDMEGMFAGAQSFNQPLNNWNVSNVWYMEAMFAGAQSFNHSGAKLTRARVPRTVNGTGHERYGARYD